MKNLSIIGYDKYCACPSGRIYSLRAGRFLQPVLQSSGYCHVTLSQDGMRNNFSVHRLIAIAFIPNGENKATVNHINGNKHDNRLSNLEEVTHQENMKKASEETNAWSFREVGEFDEKGNMLRKFANASVAAREIGILPGSMRNTIRRDGK